jgi:16S rRNA U516 pseudouridylate synthase RsuA-like enzyme
VVRRLCAELGLGIRRLIRLSYGPVQLGSLGQGRSRSLAKDELKKLYEAVKLPVPDSE